MSEVTPTYQLPYPDLTDTPNVPSDMQALALQVESVLAPIDSRAQVPQITCGELVGDGNTGIHKVTLPFAPQLVEIITQVTSPLASSLLVSTTSVGRIGRATDGTITQFVTGTRIVPGNLPTAPSFPGGSVPTGTVPANWTGLAPQIQGWFQPGAGAVAATAERRTLRTQCAGLIVDDTTLLGNASGNLLADGFTLDVQNGSSIISYFWTAHA